MQTAQVKPFSNEWIILKFLARWTDDDLKNVAAQNIRLASVLQDNWYNPFARFLRGLARSHAEELHRGLSLQAILDCLQTYRVDLYNVAVTDPVVLDWLNTNFGEVKQILGI